MSSTIQQLPTKPLILKESEAEGATQYLSAGTDGAAGVAVITS